MIIQDIITSIRFIVRNKAFAAINITGLTIGIFSCLLIILYIHSELTFDRFHEKGQNIYRVVMHQPGNRVVGSSSDWWVVSPAILKPTWENTNASAEVDFVYQHKGLIFPIGVKSGKIGNLRSIHEFTNRASHLKPCSSGGLDKCTFRLFVSVYLCIKTGDFNHLTPEKN